MREVRESGRFVPGHHYSPATQIRRGERLSPSTEFRPGQDAPNRLPVGSVSVRIETHTQLPRAWIKTAEPNVWRKRSIVVWESLHGRLPRGCVVHHRDRDSLNDSSRNLQGLTRAEHIEEHRGDATAWRK